MYRQSALDNPNVNHRSLGWDPGPRGSLEDCLVIAAVAEQLSRNHYAKTFTKEEWDVSVHENLKMQEEVIPDEDAGEEEEGDEDEDAGDEEEVPPPPAKKAKNARPEKAAKTVLAPFFLTHI